MTPDQYREIQAAHLRIETQLTRLLASQNAMRVELLGRKPVSPRDAVCEEIIEIMAEYDRQNASGYIDTPGGLEHMGDVWGKLDGWRKKLIAG